MRYVALISKEKSADVPLLYRYIMVLAYRVILEYIFPGKPTADV